MSRPTKPFIAAAVVLVALLAAGGIFLAVRWPFTRERVTSSLEQATASRVRIGTFRQTFFPHPGCVLGDVAFVRDGAPPLATIRLLTIQGSWPALLTLTHRLKLMRADGLHVRIPAHVPPPVPSQSPGTEATIGELAADGAVLEIASHHPGGQPLRFDFSRLSLYGAAKKNQIRFRTILHIPEPPGDVRATGTFGPWNSVQAGLTPVSGSFELTHADLGRFAGIAGMLSSTGSFHGTLSRIEVTGRATVPDFEVTSSHHSLSLRAGYQGVVNALTGDVLLPEVQADFLRTRLSARGRIAGEPGESGKTVSLDFSATRARIQDLLRLLVKEEPAPLDGHIVFRAHVVLPPGDQAFLRKLRLDGAFGIDDASFARPQTQGKVEELSSRALGEGDRPERVVSDLKGKVVLRNGTATFSDLSFTVPGARAQGGGTYDLIAKQVDLHGTLAMEAPLSKAAGGIKSILLKPFDSFFRKKPAGSVVPAHISGPYSHPAVGVSLTGKK